MPEPTREQVLLQMETICRSEAFEGLKRSKALVRYIVEALLAGKKLTEGQIAHEFFKKDPSTYHPKLNPIVRVSIGNLRKRLEKYYATRGAGDPVIIDIPRGAYRAEVRLNPDINRNESAPSLTLNDARRSYLQARSRFERRLAALGFPSADSPLPAEMHERPWTGYKTFRWGVWSALQFCGVSPIARLSEEVQLYIKSEGFARAVLEHEDGIVTYYYLPSRGLRIKKVSENEIIVNYLPSDDEPGCGAYNLLFRYSAIVGTDPNL